MSDSSICLVTIHGVGFQRRPTKGVPMSGYADMLHARLCDELDEHPARLSDDPTTQRPDAGRGGAGPVYVESVWPIKSENTEGGLSRLGKWRDDTHPRQVGAVDGSKAPLAEAGSRLSHVALVYSRMEDQGPHLGPAVETVATSVFELGHYAGIFSAAHMLFADIGAILHHGGAAPEEPPSGGVYPSSLRVRDDERPAKRQPAVATAAGADAKSTGLAGTIRGLVDDVATYIYHNELRDRVRGFVREALLRLIYREDVAGIVVNAHSQGTIVAYDVLSQLNPFEASRVAWLVTAGSPLRKYVDLFHWGNNIGGIRAVGAEAKAPPADVLNPCWTNYWDRHDPVGDPLTSERLPKNQQSGAGAGGKTLFRWLNSQTGKASRVCVDDQEVDNVRNSIGGGLQAHNYWDNQEEFVVPLAQKLRALVSQTWS